ncbi:MAG: phosphoribosylformylglycinamidine synthase subunit PurQ [SAR202 cluster bacterium]|nr:phosphoribosylformylglycinamidine synthase subunit PurQ [SAR202 cluster bacterium]|tara:strand:+ start:56492 stop:57205 length:714 start_codon:yes stop_codon:yes gene_type:complete
MSTKFGVIVFPGTWSEGDWLHALTGIMGFDAEYIFHKQTDISNFDCLVIPGGFSYGDYLRPGAIARFSPVMGSIIEFANSGGPVIGSCNGFQILCEAGLLPGALIRNESLEFRCQKQHLIIENNNSPFMAGLNQGEVISLPISHGDGNYFVDDVTLADMEFRGQIALKYCDAEGKIAETVNPNGSVSNIAGVTNELGNVLGLMPHPERVVEQILGGVDGIKILQSVDHFLSRKLLNE